MTMRSLTLWAEAVAVSLVALSLIGCGGGESYQVAEVDGVLLIGGKPAPKVFVEFIPDVSGTDSPPASAGETDADGHFSLTTRQRHSSPQPGAVVGSHRVVLRDLQLAASATGAGVPIRMSGDYSQVNTTPLREEVKEGPQTITIDLPPYRGR